jgi:site-specific DNA-methyltransferase (adenine-specific)
MELQMVTIESLTLDPNNARKHSKRNLDSIAQSLVKFGQRKPLVVHRGVVLAGNGTLEAARSIGWTEIEVTYVPDDWDSDTAKAYALADNRSSELAEWDEKILSTQLLDLDDMGWNIEALGFEPLPLRDLDEGAEDEIPEPPVEPVTKLGQVWQIGRHRVMCGDSSDPATLNRLRGKAIMQAVVTDPPYGINANKQTLGNGKKEFHRGDNWDKAKPSVKHILDLAPIQIIWGGNYFADELPPTNDWLCWYKKMVGMSFSEFELAWTNLGKQARLLEHHWSGEEKMHPTMKPLPVMTWCMSFLPENANVLDVYAGAGSTLVAAEKTGRNGFGIELDPVYVDVIIQRLENLTGLKAELIP